MVLRELLGSTDLSGAQVLRIHELTEVMMVRKDENLMLAAFQIVTPRLKSFEDSQKLVIVGFIACFCWNYFPRKERYRVLLA